MIKILILSTSEHCRNAPIQDYTGRLMRKPIEKSDLGDHGEN
jgi:hypothetical protein